VSSDALPEGWEERPLRDCVDVLDNLRVPINSDERARRPGSIPYYGATGQVGWIDDFIFDEELLLLGEDGAPFLEKSKDVAYVVRGKTWVNNHAHVLRPRTGTVSTLFLKHYLNSFDYADHVNGTTRLKLTQASMNSIPVPLPPLAEQKRIVAKVEELLASVNVARDRLARVPAILKRFRQAVLMAACEGRLTEEWRAMARKREDAHCEADPLVEALTELPETWRWSTCEGISDRTRPITYGVIKLGPPVPGGIPVLRSSDVRELKIDESGVKRISKEIASEYSRTFLRGGEVVVTVRGSLGGIAVVPERMAGFNVSREVAVLPLRGEVPDYIALAIASDLSQKWLAEVVKGVAYSGINIADLKRLPLPIPPVEEQKLIVERVRALFAFANTIERRVTNAAARADKLTQAILARAFRGELVATEPT
jgi:type I restriction enzyme S subunit